MTQGPDPGVVRSMFARVARRYDLANRLLSLGQDQRWRARLRQAVAVAPPGPVLDLATGTGDVALGFCHRDVVGADFCLDMLAYAVKKQRRKAGPGRWVAGDVQRLPFRAGVFAAVTVAFGWRNFPDPAAAFFEVRRILRCHGILAILEFHPVEGALFRAFHRLWQKLVIEPVGGWVSGDGQAYRYLPASSRAFVSARELAGLAQEAGFRLLYRRPLGLRVACLSVFEKEG
ncbi:MAG: ubiquinone/menaquinone biosynthesis methyltransferase [Thermoanaerobaculum sp.]